jgi:hypothetical protein
MAKKKKLRMRKENLILFVLLGLGLLLFVFNDYDNWHLSDTEREMKTTLENEGYKVQEVWGSWLVVMKDSPSDTTSEQVFKGLHIMSLYKDWDNPHGWFSSPSIWIVEDDGRTCMYGTSFTNYPSYWKTLNGERVFVEYLDGYEQLDRRIFGKVVENADKDYNYNLSTFRTLYWESYPEVTHELLAPLVWYQVMKDPTCADSIEDL